MDILQKVKKYNIGEGGTMAAQSNQNED